MRDRFSAPHPNFHVYAGAEPIDDRHETINREPPEIRVADA
jgi:hypothetical protein